MCGLSELWILYDVAFVKEMRGCMPTTLGNWGQGLQVAEIAWSYFLPLILITILDFRVRNLM
jgi:hypothetical protein